MFHWVIVWRLIKYNLLEFSDSPTLFILILTISCDSCSSASLSSPSFCFKAASSSASPGPTFSHLHHFDLNRSSKEIKLWEPPAHRAPVSNLNPRISSLPRCVGVCSAESIIQWRFESDVKCFNSAALTVGPSFSLSADSAHLYYYWIKLQDHNTSALLICP